MGITFKKEFAEYIYSICNASSNLRDSGILNVYDEFQNINWKK